MSERNVNLYFDDINSSIKKIIKYTKGISFRDFVKDEKTVDAVIRNLEIIGEAANNIPKNIKIKHKGIPWTEMIGIRNKVIHEYFGIDLEILWKTVKDDIPFLKKKIRVSQK